MKLSCQCGNISVKVNSAPPTLTSCNCSICHRYGSLWGYYQPAEVVVEIAGKGTGVYAWGDKHLEFIYCLECACVTHYQTTAKVEVAKIGVNFRMAKATQIEGIRVRHFDGADTWQHLD